jgi:hypothetical protein
MTTTRGAIGGAPPGPGGGGPSGLMDRIYPEWRQVVDPGTLDMSDGCQCVWGKIGGNYVDVVAWLDPDALITYTANNGHTQRYVEITAGLSATGWRTTGSSPPRPWTATTSSPWRGRPSWEWHDHETAPPARPRPSPRHRRRRRPSRR